MKNLRARTNLQGSSGHGTGTLSSLIAVAIVVLIIVSLNWAQAVVIPVALAMLLTFLLSPVVGALERLALGRIVSVILVVVLTFSLLGGIGWIVSRQFGSLAKLTSCRNTRLTSGKKYPTCAGRVREAPWRKFRRPLRK